jgi:hypothetical protein
MPRYAPALSRLEFFPVGTKIELKTGLRKAGYDHKDLTYVPTTQQVA